MKLLILFVVLNIVNVVLQTIRSIAQIKCGKMVAALTSAIGYGLYTVVVIYMNCELNLWAKVAVVAITNFIGVWVVKLAEEKMRKDRLWEIKFTVRNDNDGAQNIDKELIEINIPHYHIPVGEHTVYTTYCATQADSHKVREIITKHNAKYFATETKLL